MKNAGGHGGGIPSQMRALNTKIAALENRVDSLESWRAVMEAWRTTEEGAAEQRFRILANVSNQMDMVRAQLAALLQTQKL